MQTYASYITVAPYLSSFLVLWDMSIVVPAMDVATINQFLINEGVRQSTARQQTTMDKTGTLSIFLYNNCEEEESQPLANTTVTPAALITEDPDNIDDTFSVSVSTSRSGRQRKSTLNKSDTMVFY